MDKGDHCVKKGSTRKEKNNGVAGVMNEGDGIWR